jgi:ribose-phosphate pyrophosphokinase
MKLFYTRSTNYLSTTINLPKGNYTVKNFSDGELYVKLVEDVKDQTVWAIASTYAPGDNLIELFLLLDALQRSGAHINLFMPYFGYARQDQAGPGEALSAQVISNFLKSFKLNKICIIDAHSRHLHEYLEFVNLMFVDIPCDLVTDYKAVAAPDKGAYDLASAIAQRCHKDLLLFTKARPEQEKVTILSMAGTVTGEPVLIVDNLISTGNTILNAAAHIRSQGVRDIAVFAVHALFSQETLIKLEESPLTKIMVTNTVPQTSTNSKLIVLDIGPFIEKTIRSYA